MASQHLQVSISAENQEQADAILNTLLAKKLVTGGQIISAPARFWWKGAILDMQYCSVTSFTLARFKNEIIAEVRKVSVEEVPMISFTVIDGNVELLDWIDQTLS
jgi:uncharacterized protein involved in tolerance to divalent cations